MEKSMKQTNDFPFLIALVVAGIFVWSGVADAQEDSIYRIRRSGKVSKVGGKIVGITATMIKFESRNGAEEIPVWEVEKIVSASEPQQVERARDRIENGRYADALDELDQAKTGGKPLVDAEVAWLRALANAELALSGGNVTASAAATEMGNFLGKFKSSHHVIPATAWMGKLGIAAGELDFATKQFSKLSQAKWPEYAARGMFQKGETLMMQAKFPEASQSFDQLIGLAATDDSTQLYKTLAKIEKAKVEGMSGNTDAAIQALEQIIDAENPDNKQLFAYAYNALGSCYMKKNDVPRAVEKFLFTHVLFDTEADPHAEAVYNLASIWTAQKKTDRASEYRDLLNSRYRNSWWASQLTKL